MTALTNTGVGRALYSVLTAVFSLVNAILTLFETGGVLAADGAEQTLYLENAPLGNYAPRVLVIDLDAMDAGDTTVIRIYYRIVAGGGLQQEAYTSFAGADGGLASASKLYSFSLHPNRYGMKVTLQQTAGVNRSYTWQVFVEA